MEIFEQVKAILVEQFYREKDAVNMDASFVDRLEPLKLENIHLRLKLI